MAQRGFACVCVHERVENDVGGVVGNVAEGVGENSVVGFGKQLANAERGKAPVAVKIRAEINGFFRTVHEGAKETKIRALRSEKV